MGCRCQELTLACRRCITYACITLSLEAKASQQHIQLHIKPQLFSPKPQHHNQLLPAIVDSKGPIYAMPPVRTARGSKKAPPDGFEDIEDTLLEFQNKMKDAENAPHDGKKKYEMTWPVFQITHQRSRYIYDLYYEKEAISKQLYDWLLKNGYADAMLIAKWKKQGYEKVCYFLFGFAQWPLMANLKIAVLPPMHPDQGNQLPIDLYLSRTERAAEGEPRYTVRQLRVQRVCVLRLSGTKILDEDGTTSTSLPVC